MHFFHGNSALHSELPKPSDEILGMFIFTLLGIDRDGVGVNWIEIMTRMYELAEVCVKTNYYGAKKMTKALLLLQLSDSPRVVSLSSGMGSLKAKGVLSYSEKLAEERIDDALNEFLKDFKEDILETKGWPTSLSAYILSKAAVNAFTRMIARKYPNICINSVVKTNMNFINTGMLVSIDEGAESVVRLAMQEVENLKQKNKALLKLVGSYSKDMQTKLDMPQSSNEKILEDQDRVMVKVKRRRSPSPKTSKPY
ncbi:unnamed protein product [Prunus armeniaca]